MSLLPYTAIQDGHEADDTLFNTRFQALHDLVNGNLDASNLADNAVTTPKITADAITTVKIADKAITSRKAALSTIGAAATTLNPLPTTLTEIANSSVTFTCDVASYLIVTFGSLIQNNQTSAAVVHLYLDGVQAAPEPVQFNNNTTSQVYVSVSRSVRLTLAAGSHTINLRGLCTAAATSVAINPFWWGILVAQP